MGLHSSATLFWEGQDLPLNREEEDFPRALLKPLTLYQPCIPSLQRWDLHQPLLLAPSRGTQLGMREQSQEQQGRVVLPAQEQLISKGLFVFSV